MLHDNVLRLNTVANPNIEQRIQLGLSDPKIQEINAKLQNFSRHSSHLLLTEPGQRKYHNLQWDKLSDLMFSKNRKVDATILW